MARVFKGMYYATTNLLDAGKDYILSHAWRSILFGRELLMKGLVKLIGRGSTALIWQDKWIFDEIPRQPVNKKIFMDFNLKVSELSDRHGHWKMKMVTDMFPENEVKRILALNMGGKEVKFIWTYTNHESYTVKSGYWFLANTKARREVAMSSVEQQRIDLKNRVWKMATLPKIRMFLWRVLSGAIAVAYRLNSRGLNVSPTCQLCKTDHENINHVLFLCDAASSIWTTTTIPLPPAGSSISLEDNLSFLMDLMDHPTPATSVVKTIPWMLWSIWKNRNAILFAAK